MASSMHLRGRTRARSRLMVLIAAVVLLLNVMSTAASAQVRLPTQDDPRVGLAPGAGETAGQAISNLAKLASLPKPASVSNTNSDLAFTGDYVISGNYNGFNVYDVSDP